MPKNGGLEKRVGLSEAVNQREDQARIIALEAPKAQFVVFLLENTYFAFPGEAIKEILPLGEITYVPGMPEYLLGVINVRGEIESVLDLRKVCALPPSSRTKRSRIMLGQVQDVRSGVLVDSVEDVLELPEAQIHNLGGRFAAAWTDYLAGESTYKEHQLIILDLDKIFERLWDN